MLPYDIILEIIEYSPLYSNKNIFMSNKFFFDLYKEKYLKNIVFIQKMYRKHKLPKIFLYPNVFLMYYDYEHWQRIFNRNNNIKIYRYIITNLSLSYLKVFPEFVLKKALYYNSSRHLVVKDWMENNLPKNTEERNRRDILKFFKENKITFKEITTTGI